MIVNAWIIAGIIMILMWISLAAGLVLYEVRHPCIRESTHRVFVPELTTYTYINTGETVFPVPNYTPAHYEDETVCEERKR